MVGGGPPDLEMVIGDDMRWLYTLLVLAVAAERLLELVISRRHERWLRQHGGIEVGSGHYPWMVLLHTLFLISCVGEVWVLGRESTAWLATVMLAMLVGAMALRYWVIATLGRRWTTRVIFPQGEPLIESGPFRYLRHPNYLAVVTEIVALPMVYGAWLTALVFSVANAALLRVRIRIEDEALGRRVDARGRLALRTTEARRGGK